MRKYPIGSRPPFVPIFHGSQALTSPSWGSCSIGCRKCGGNSLSGQAPTGSRAEPQARLSEPRPPKPTCCPAPGLPLYWPGAASRAETGRGAADPLGELTCTSLFRPREEELKGGRVGEGPLPTVCHQRHRSMALNTHDSRGKDTRVSPSIPPGQESHTVDSHIIRSTLPPPAAASMQNSEAQSNNDHVQ